MKIFEEFGSLTSTLSLSLSLPSFCSSLSLKNAGHCFSLTLGSTTPATSPGRVTPQLCRHQLHLHPSISTTLSGEENRAAQSLASTAHRLPPPFPATTGHHFRRDHDQKNHLNALYTKVPTISPFFVVKKSTYYCASSPFSCEKCPSYCCEQ